MDDVSFYQLSSLWWPDVVFPHCQHLREVWQMGKYELQREDISNCCCFKERIDFFCRYFRKGQKCWNSKSSKNFWTNELHFNRILSFHFIYCFLKQSLKFFVLRESFPLGGCGNWSNNSLGTWANLLAFPGTSSWLRMFWCELVTLGIYTTLKVYWEIISYANKMVRKVVFLFTLMF